MFSVLSHFSQWIFVSVNTGPDDMEHFKKILFRNHFRIVQKFFSEVHSQSFLTEFLAMLDCLSRVIAVSMASLIRRPSVKCVFSETV